MNAYKRRIQITVVMTLILIHLSGCSRSMRPESDQAKEADTLFAYLKAQNDELKRFKGIGNFKIFRESRFQKLRCAFAVELPDKLRVEFFGFPAGAEASFSGDGTHLYYKNRRLEQYKKVRSRKGNLEKIVFLPLAVEDVAFLLGGRVPHLEKLQPTHFAVENNTPVLTLKTKWLSKTYKIYFDEQKKSVIKIESFDSMGQPILKTEISKMQDIDGFKIPKTFTVTDGSETRITFRIDRFWSNVEIPESFFILSPL